MEIDRRYLMCLIELRGTEFVRRIARCLIKLRAVRSLIGES